YLDFVLAGLVLISLSWLFLLILILYMLSYQLPVFFMQERIGKGEKIFRLIKFRSLKNTRVNLKEREFWLGNILRRTSLDELPQLLNVLKGEMSLIGPRALPVEYQPLFSSEQRKRFSVLPGITGWAQVNGRHSISWKKKFELDNYYVDHISFLLDMKILFKTMVLLLSFQPDRSLLEEKFTGHD